MSELNELFGALADAQKQFPSIKKDTKGYGYKYAQLDQVIEATRPHLNEHGLSITQFPVSNETKIGIRTILAHISGQTIAVDYLQKPQKEDMQSIGSMQTYMRRYAWLAVCGVHPEDEDDDAAASQPKVYEQEKPRGGSEFKASAKQQKLIDDLFEQGKISDKTWDWIADKGGVSKLTSAQAKQIIEAGLSGKGGSS